MTVVACVLVASAVAATIAQCRVLLREADWQLRRVLLEYERAEWTWDAECDYAGLRALATALEAQSADADVRVREQP